MYKLGIGDGDPRADWFYEVRIRHGNTAVIVEAVWDSNYSGPPQGWRSSLLGTGDCQIYVWSPTWFEKMMGKTFESKIADAKQRCQRWCDNENSRLLEVRNLPLEVE